MKALRTGEIKGAEGHVVGDDEFQNAKGLYARGTIAMEVDNAVMRSIVNTHGLEEAGER